jgi:hypothetical protein
MSLLDKVKDAATKAAEQSKQVANKAAEQSKHALAVGKEKVEDVKLRKQLDETFEKIGRIVVSQRRGSADADADAQIDAAVAEVGDLETQIEANNVEDESTEAGEGDTPAADAQ